MAETLQEKHHQLLSSVERAIVIDFKPDVKCRAIVHLTSHHPTLPVYFKVQTSSPHKFHVRPPSGHVSPLSTVPLHVILLPQSNPPPNSVSRSRCDDRFLILSSLSDRNFPQPPESPAPIRLKVVYVGTHLLPSASSETHDHVAAENNAGRKWRVFGAMERGGGRRDRSGVPLRKAEAAEGEVNVMTRRMVEDLGSEEMLKEERDGEGRTALHAAAQRGNVSCASTMLEMGADLSAIDRRGRTALDLARERGHEEMVELLERWEHVMAAARHSDLGRLEYLLRKRNGVHGHDQYGWTALHAAAIKGRSDAIAMLVDYGMDVNAVDVEGHTPLHLAVESGCTTAVELLIDLGADTDAATNRGSTPLQIAAMMSYEEIAQLLMLRRGAAGAGLDVFAAASPSSTLSTSARWN